MFGLAMLYSTNVRLTAIPITMPNSIEYAKQAISVQTNGMISIPKSRKRD